MEAFLNPNMQAYLLAYLLGSIPFGWLFVMAILKKDIRKIGSGGTGATNVYRALKDADIKNAKLYAMLTIVLDALKSTLPILIAISLGAEDSVLWAMAVLATIGHCYSIYLFFEGGKGVATAFGGVIVLVPIEALIGLAVWFLVAKQSSVSSLASLCGLLAATAASFIIHPGMEPIHTHVPLVLIAFIVLYKHIPNIIRLVRGEEKKLAL